MTAAAPQTPGVSIVELSSTSLSVQGSATAVPVFIGRFLIKDATRAECGACIRINNKLELERLLYGQAVSIPTVPSGFGSSELEEQTDSKDNADLRAPNVLSASNPYCFPGEHLTYEVVFSQPATESTNYACTVLYEATNTAKIDIDYEASAKIVSDDEVEQIYDLGVQPDTYHYFTTSSGCNSYKMHVKTKPHTSGVVFQKIAFLTNSNYHTNGPWGTGKILGHEISIGYCSLELYFNNGGGPCYILPLVDGAGAELARLPDLIREECLDATVLLCADTDQSLELIKNGLKKIDIYRALSPLQLDQPAYFLIADHSEEPISSFTSPMQTAIYYPGLQCTTSSLQGDSGTLIIGFDGVNNLADLKNQDPSLYSLIHNHLNKQRDILLPSCAAIAAAYARTDRERGVWKAPANIPLSGVRGLETVISETAQGPLNKVGINVIRWFSDRGPVVYGARTLAVDSKEWLYVPVRRLFNMAERDIKNTMQTMVFEPNNQATWEKTRGAIDNYLRSLWKQGALLGETEKEAYFVQVGLDITMTQEQIDAGQMIVKVGMAAVRPAEFIILQFTQDTEQS